MDENDPQLKVSTTPELDIETLEDKYHCKINLDIAEVVISAALEEYEHHELGFFDSKNQAEEEYINLLIAQGETKEFITTAIFLLSLATFGSDSKVFYDNLVRNFKDYKDYRWLFIPPEVCKSKLFRVKNKWERINGGTYLFPELFMDDQMLNEPEANSFFPHEEDALEFNSTWEKHMFPQGRQRAALIAWYHNCCILYKTYHGHIFEFFEAHNFDATEIHQSLYFKPQGSTVNKEFKRFEKKLACLFLQWVGRYELYPLKNIDEFGLPIDLHLCRIAVQTGIVEPQVDIPRPTLAYGIFWPVVDYLCKKNKEKGWRPKLVSESLWLIGSQGCTPDQKAFAPYLTCPLKPLCKGVIGKLKNEDAFYPNISALKKMKKFREWGSQDRLY